MPEDEYYPFIKILYKTQTSWALSNDSEHMITQYAKLGGLSEAKAKACLADTVLQNAIVAERTDATQKYAVESTPTFIVNNGVAKLSGAQPVDAFAAVFDRLLNQKATGMDRPSDNKSAPVSPPLSAHY